MNPLSNGAACASTCSRQSSRRGQLPDDARNRRVRHWARKRSSISWEAFCACQGHAPIHEAGVRIPQAGALMRRYGGRTGAPDYAQVSSLRWTHRGYMERRWKLQEQLASQLPSVYAPFRLQSEAAKSGLIFAKNILPLLTRELE